MSTHLLLIMALTGPELPSTEAQTLRFAVAPWTSEELQVASREVVSRLRDVQKSDAGRDVRDLLLLRAAVLATKELSRSEQIQTRNRIDYCLEQALGRLQRQQARLAKQTAAKPTSGKSRPNLEPSLNGGSAQAAQVQQLISLIEAAIQPESWAANGGLGTIQYWVPGYALVIRNSQATHEEIGGLLRTLEAQQR